MKTPALLATIVATSSLTSLTAHRILEPTRHAEAPPAALHPDRLAAIERSLTHLQEELAAKTAALQEELALAEARHDAGRERKDARDLESLVRGVLAVEGQGGKAALIEPPTRPLGELLAELEAIDDPLEVQRFWQRMREEGRTEELLAAFEARAEAAPGDPEVQVALGQAYLQRIQEVGNGPLAGVLANKADQAFDAALAVDPQMWSARFQKAVALSFWPPVFGKQNEAIAQFEVLVQQQAGLPPDPKFAQTHLLLGNMYQQIGQTEKAIAAWQAGLSLFPGDKDLLAQLELVQDQ